MGKVLRFDPHRPLGRSAALEKIRRFWLDGCYVPSAHAIERMEQRRFHDPDIGFLIFESGRVTGHTKVDGAWRYKVAGKSIDGKRMAAIFEFEGPLMILVTVHDR